MASKTFRTTLLGERIPLTFDPKKVFGKLRVPVRVTLRGHSYRSTIFSMDGCTFVPLRRSHREAAGLEGTEVVTVRLDLDTDKRVVKPPTDLVEALKAAAPAWEAGASSVTRINGSTPRPSGKRESRRPARAASLPPCAHSAPDPPGSADADPGARKRT